ncbi:histone-lysine N-methyltransferase SETMAR [Trichonephila clavipes]|nr:histone-lysine N-methyltransferase SETMAR [Trichonephila clavipes]
MSTVCVLFKCCEMVQKDSLRANSVKTTLQQFRWETLENPSYSPDLSPCDFHVFGSLKRAIPRHRFTTDNEACPTAAD